MSIKFFVLGGGEFGVWGGGGSADFIFMGAGIFLKISLRHFFDTLAFLKRAFPHARVRV